MNESEDRCPVHGVFHPRGPSCETQIVAPGKPQMFRKKPVVIEAMRFHGDAIHQVASWCSGTLFSDGGLQLTIGTLEGVMTCSYGDWVIKGVEGEFYPCKPEIFRKTYEPITEGES